MGLGESKAAISASRDRDRSHDFVSSVTVTKTCVDAHSAACTNFGGIRCSLTHSHCTSSILSFHSFKLPADAMPKDKSEKKSKKSKEVTETVEESIVTGGDVEMGDVEVAKVRTLLLVNLIGMLTGF